ncbi:MAG: GNAT family N-acetyltransferase [Oceanicaulis sp.]|nr:GNAT family N-acetyltransferase [Oceanicaulis sp.]
MCGVPCGPDGAAPAELTPADLTTARLALRRLELPDAAFLAREGGRPEVARMVARIPSPCPALASEHFVLATRAAEAIRGDLVRLITWRTDGAPLGVIGLHPHGDGVWELGYWLAASAWGRGIATEAGAAMIADARIRGIERLIAGHFSDNPASARVLIKLGFAYSDGGSATDMFSMGRMARAAHRTMALHIGPQTG